MCRFRMVQMGLGGFGSRWFEDILCPWDRVEVAGVVTGNPERHDWVINLSGIGRDRIYSDLGRALDELKPDLFLNVTPPGVHLATSMEAIRRRIPVLCEKPVAEGEEDALALERAAVESGVPVAIGENYRFLEVAMRARELLASGAIGRIGNIDLYFARHHDMMGYHLALEHPMILDVGIHHLDLIRYLTGREAVEVFARSWAPSWSHYRKNGNVIMDLLLEDDIHVSYHGGLAFYRHETDWFGVWTLDGENGMLKIEGDTITVTGRDGTRSERVAERTDSKRYLLANVLDALESGARAATDIRDNMKTYRLAGAAARSADTLRVVRL